MGNTAKHLQIFKKESILILFQINFSPKHLYKLKIYHYEESTANQSEAIL